MLILIDDINSRINQLFEGREPTRSFYESETFSNTNFT